MAEKLTPEQRQAVEHRGGRLLVSAAAGSGKTKVLVDRLMGYLTDPVQPANIDDFLMITYTKAAASELRGKIASKLSERIAEDPDDRHLQQQLQRLYLTKISTVHAFCGDILREYAYKLDISGDFRVADENECREIRTQVVEKLLDRAYENTDETPAFCAFVDTQGLGRDDKQLADLVLRVYDSARCHLNPDQWLEMCRKLVSTDGVTDPAQTLYGKFLLERLAEFLRLQITSLEHCIALAAETEGFEKPTALLSDTVYQLKKLYEQKSWDGILGSKDIDFGTLRFPKNCADPGLAENIKILRESCKKSLVKQLKPFADPAEQILCDLDSIAPAVDGLVELARQFEEAYTAAKRGRQLLDFGDLEHKMLDLLLGSSRSGPTSAAAEVGSCFREVMVDEYQDSNEVQDAIYEALTRKRNNLFMVGDVKQSIYQFRLADPGIFLEKYGSFAPAEEAAVGQDTKVLLSRNFRSSGGVLAAANDVFRMCMCPEVGGLYYGTGEALYEGIPHIPLGEPETELYCIDVQEETYPEEAAFTAGRILELLDGTHMVRQGDKLRPIVPEDIAILLRSPGSMGSYYQQALEAVGVRCATGGGVDLLQLPEIATLRSVLQAIHNPMQDIPLVAAMASPVFGFTADDLACLRSRNRKCAFYDVVRMDDTPKTREFMNVFLKLRDALRLHSLTGLLEQIFLLTHMDSVYAAMADGAARAANLQSFFQLAADFEGKGGRDLGRFLEHLDAMEEKGLISAGEQTRPGCVTIMSIHKSKGLEFPVVFLCGLSRGFNMESQRAKVLCHKDMGLGLSAADARKRIYYPTIAKRAISAKIGMDAVSEEMRVLYVAMTRAKDRLIMTYASDSLEKELSSMVSMLDMDAKKFLIREADCAGQWVLLTALQRTEAGALFALSAKPRQTQVSEIPWHIRVVTASGAEPAEAADDAAVPISDESLTRIQENLDYRYAHRAATQMPSKQTATQRKGRVKDQEAAENTQAVMQARYQWRRPGFVPEQSRGKEYGTAMHAVMQYIDYGACLSEAAVKAEVRRLVDCRFITEEQGNTVSCKKLAAFFASDFGKKLCLGATVEREFKFSILEDGSTFDPELADEQILLQGVVDCLLIEEDGITVLDFKTDYVTEETVSGIAQRYRPQVAAYANAVQRIFQLPVKQALLYFFSIDTFWVIE